MIKNYLAKVNVNAVSPKNLPPRYCLSYPRSFFLDIMFLLIEIMQSKGVAKQRKAGTRFKSARKWYPSTWSGTWRFSWRTRSTQTLQQACVNSFAAPFWFVNKRRYFLFFCYSSFLSRFLCFSFWRLFWPLSTRWPCFFGASTSTFLSSSCFLFWTWSPSSSTRTSSSSTAASTATPSPPSALSLQSSASSSGWGNRSGCPCCP